MISRSYENSGTSIWQENNLMSRKLNKSSVRNNFKLFCSSCGKELPEESKFCVNCGFKLLSDNSSHQNSMTQTEKETEYFRGDGEVIIKRTQHKGLGIKAVSWLAGGPIGYVAFGRDKKSNTKAKGTLIVTNKAIYCAGNEYPFDRILGITKGGTLSKSIILTFEHQVKAGGAADGPLAGTGGISVEVELKTDNLDNLFKALEEAKIHNKF